VVHKEFADSSIIIDEFHVIGHFSDVVNSALRLDLPSGEEF